VHCEDTHIINDCPVNKFERGLYTALYTPLSSIPPESGYAEFTAYAKERLHDGVL